MSVRIARIFNTYGPRMRVDDGRAIPAFFKAALQERPLQIHSDGRQTRSLCYVDDLIEGFLQLLLSAHDGPMNLGNPEEVSILELAQSVQTVVGAETGIEFHPRPVDDPQVRRPDTTLAEQVLGWKPQIALVEGLQRTLPWFESEVRGSRGEIGDLAAIPVAVLQGEWHTHPPSDFLTGIRTADREDITAKDSAA